MEFRSTIVPSKVSASILLSTLAALLIPIDRECCTESGRRRGPSYTLGHRYAVHNGRRPAITVTNDLYWPRFSRSSCGGLRAARIIFPRLALLGGPAVWLFSTRARAKVLVLVTASWSPDLLSSTPMTSPGNTPASAGPAC